jgi:hypothetical protein
MGAGEHYPAHSARRDERRSFFRSAIHVSGDHLAMPMELLGSVRVVVHLDRYLLAFFKTQ